MEQTTGKVVEVALLEDAKKCTVEISEGGKKTVFVNEQVKTIYEKLKPGDWVALTPKDNGKGYLVTAILPGPPQAEQAAPQHRVLEGAELAVKIKERIGMAKYAVSLLEKSGLPYSRLDLQAICCPNAPLNELDKRLKGETIRKRCEALDWAMKQAVTSNLTPDHVDIIKIIIDL